MAFRNAPTNQQVGAAANHYVVNVSKAKKVAVICDTTGYGTASLDAYVPMLKKMGGEVVYSGSVDANNPDLKPELLRMRSAGAEAIMPWSVNAGFLARIINTRADMSWDVPIVGQTTLGSGQTKALLDKPEYWEKVYPNSFRNCSYDAHGKLPPQTARIRRAPEEGQDRPRRYAAVVGRAGLRRPRLIAEASRKPAPRRATSSAYWNKVKDWPGIYGTITWTPTTTTASRTKRSHVRRPTRSRTAPSSWPPATPARPMLGVDHLERAGGGRGLRADRHHLQRDVLGLAGVQLHRGHAGHARRRVRRALHLQDGHARRRRLPADPAAGAVLGIITEIVAVRPVLKSLDQHLYVLSTLAFALMIQQLTAIEWSTEPQPFPRLSSPIGPGIFDQKFWLPVLACIVTILGLEFLYRRHADRPRLPCDRRGQLRRPRARPAGARLRMASYALAGVIGVLGGLRRRRSCCSPSSPMGRMLNFYGFVPVALGGMGYNRGAVIGGLALGLFQQAANFLVGGIFASVAVFAVFIVVLLARPEGLAGAATARRV